MEALTVVIVMAYTHMNTKIIIDLYLQGSSNSVGNLPELDIVGLKENDSKKLKDILVKRSSNNIMRRV